MADGTLKFDTKVDDSGFVEGIQNLSSKQIKLQNAIKKTTVEMEKLEKAMNAEMGKKLPTKEYTEIQNQIESAEQKLNKYIETEMRMKDTGANIKGQAWKNLQWNIEETRGTLRAAKADMEELKLAGGDFHVGGDTTRLADMQNRYDILNGKLSEYKVKLSEVSASEAGMGTSASRTAGKLGILAQAATTAFLGTKKLGSAAVSIGGKLKQLASTAVRTAGKMVSHIGQIGGAFKRSEGHSRSFGSAIKTVLRSMILYRGIRSVFSGLANAMMSNLKTNNQFVASLAQIRGNLYTAFQPIYSACLPAINALMSALARITGYIAQFTSMLFGKSVKASQKAAKAQYGQANALKETAKAGKKANKEMSKQLSDIDELHNLSNDNSGGSDAGGGGGGGGISPDFTTPIQTSETVSDFVKKLKEAWENSDFTEIGQIVARKINGALESIPWNDIQSTSQKIAKSIYTFINGFVGELDWKLVGQTIGKGLNVAVDFANTLITGIDWAQLGTGFGENLESMVNTINWSNIGNLISNGLNSLADLINNFYSSVNFVKFGGNLATGLNTAVKNTDWSSVGSAIGNALNIAIDTAYGFIVNFDWSAFGKGIADGINGFLTTTNWAELAEGVSKLATGLLDAVSTAIRETDWQLVGNTMIEMLFSIDWAGIAGGVIDLLVEAFNGAISLLFGIGESIGSNIMQGLEDGISLSDILKNVGTWINDHIFKPIVDNIKRLFGIHSPSTVLKDIGINIMQGMINGITSLIDTVKDKFKTLLKDIKSFFTDIPKWFGDKFRAALDKIKTAFSVANAKAHFSNVWKNIKSVFSKVSNWFKDTFSKAWTNVKNVFSTGGKIFDGIKDGIASTFKSVVNRLIDGINRTIAIPFNKINDMIASLKKVPLFGGAIGGFSLSVPKIPKLATGTVVPKNYGQFLSILGDNKRETEIVSPLSTIKQALKEAMDETGGSGEEINLHLTVVRDGKKEFDEIMKINKEQAKSGSISFAVS